ncbi:DUF2184 domain-containing protein [Serratia fonticola]|jgi:hypothetical protein|uniref:DUF2184 domain-containing protein n=1 Tax=Serratia fonticola TaxID=47917 RepID=UPI00217C358D|nr:DUF2184 domain-containing protein [Serratia fonticola]CAI1592954.1 Uncharacterized protein conserved in bacteria [Serratia fonticola]CAI1905834.1 Uncharacterized protein conserved in bacteria [Serratia fonticola]CAI1926291.1 Uncharacterized protein conserved in bacteria [Serratia fonticola]
MFTYDQATVDSTGMFLIGELERLDQNINMPLVQYTWSRDIQLREDVSIADTISSFTNTSFAASGTPNANGKNWIGINSTAINGMNIDINKTGFPLTLWGMELGWTVVELAAAQQVGRPVDSQKYDGMQLKWQMDTDEQVYVGDTGLGVKGLLTYDGVLTTNAVGAWTEATDPNVIRAAINSLLSASWAKSGYTMVPTDLLLPPEKFSILSSIIVSTAGNQSLLTYLQTNTIAFHQNGRPLNIRSVKWLKGLGLGGTDRMVAYTNDRKFVRFPMVPLRNVPIQYRGIQQLTTYYGKLGTVESPYVETLAYMDGI